MSVVKLLSRMVAPLLVNDATPDAAEQTLHDYTYGITADPLTQFACALSAMIHDVDHAGVPVSVETSRKKALGKPITQTRMFFLNFRMTNW
jgi:hypothetical protein